MASPHSYLAIPTLNPTKSALSPRSARSATIQTVSEAYTNTIDDALQDIYSDTFVDESHQIYSDTFVTDTAVLETIQTEQIPSTILQRTYSDTFELLSPDDSETYSYTETFENSSSLGDVPRKSEHRIRKYEHNYSTNSEEKQIAGSDSGAQQIYDNSTTFEPTAGESYRYQSLDEHEKAAKTEFIQLILKQLEAADNDRPVSVITKIPVADTQSFSLKGSVPVPEAESKYCRRKIKLLRAKKKYGEDAFKPQAPKDNKPPLVSDYGVNPALVDRLKLHNFMTDMKHAAETEIHDPKTCVDCINHEKSLDESNARREFLRSKCVLLQRKGVEDQIAQHLGNMDPLTLVADIARSLPKLSDDPTEIMRRLNEPLNNKLT